MSAESNGSTNWGSVVIGLAIVALVGFALYLTHSPWVLLGLLLIPAVWSPQPRPKAGKCHCETKGACQKNDRDRGC